MTTTRDDDADDENTDCLNISVTGDLFNHKVRLKLIWIYFYIF